MNFTDLQAAIGRVQLRRLDNMSKHRARLVQYYKEALEQLGLTIQFQANVSDPKHAKHLLVGVFDPVEMGISRNELLCLLKGHNIGVSVHYNPLHYEKLYYDGSKEELPVTDFLADKIMTLPIGPRVTCEDIDYVVHYLTREINQNRH
jgi:dTDP-4-amino-4,6-dideoxygalactose transaminase